MHAESTYRFENAGQHLWLNLFKSKRETLSKRRLLILNSWLCPSCLKTAGAQVPKRTLRVLIFIWAQTNCSSTDWELQRRAAKMILFWVCLPPTSSHHCWNENLQHPYLLSLIMNIYLPQASGAAASPNSLRWALPLCAWDQWTFTEGVFRGWGHYYSEEEPPHSRMCSVLERKSRKWWWSSYEETSVSHTFQRRPSRVRGVFSVHNVRQSLQC